MLTVVSLTLPYLLGLGCFLFPASKGLIGTSHPDDDTHRLQLIAVVLIFGIELNHLLALLLVDLKLAVTAGGLAAVVGMTLYLTTKPRFFLPIVGTGWGVVALLLYAASMAIVFSEPVSGWDARSIWFFHGKIIYYAQSVATVKNWSLPSIAFSHPDYPLLVPLLAAQTAFVAGYWNEYLPKLGMIILLVPAMLFLLSILIAKRWQIVLVAIPLLFVREYLTNGYMDGYLALYMGIATFYWGRWIEAKEPFDLISAILCSGVTLHLKNEGMLYAVILIALLASFDYVTNKGRSLLDIPGRLRIVLITMVPASGTLLWKWYVWKYGLNNDLQLGAGSFGRMAARFADGSFTIILKHLYGPANVNLSLGLFLFVLVLTLWMGRRPRLGALFCASAAIVYFCGLVAIYMSTPYDLIGFHLPTGVRTMLPVHTMLLAAAFSLLRGSERSKADAQVPRRGQS